MKKLQVSMLAPDFQIQPDLNLSDFREKYVILFFYPAADTYGCTREACGFRDIYEELLDLNCVVVGVSVDDSESQEIFKLKNELQYYLVTDTSKEISKLYSGLGRLGKANRITFLIDLSGRIQKIWKLTSAFKQLRLGLHANEVKEAIMELSVSNHLTNSSKAKT